MALRPGRTIRRVKRPYTRVSKRVPRKSYVVGVPFPKTHQFEMGKKAEYDITILMISKRRGQIRDQSLESARIVAVNFLEKNLGTEFFFKILVYPHQVIREKPIAMGAGADRYSQGMARSYGKPVGTAAVVNVDQPIMIMKVSKKNFDIGWQALKRASLKLSVPVHIEEAKEKI